ncbi:uncharacterized protein A4U43_C09F110 [Asparagus officinalis]|uniref:XS domain-containing protein n=1 Tax=Asparagus officinalis TaxID=4686 RepID=A0A5P1E4F0_ASPOF|nr:uncharacterized protein A4U43_C09F110 [Asparagus officinalis]
MGFDAGKVRVCRGKPANQSVLVVKFSPTLSGLQEAERLHNFYADKNRGRQGFEELTSNHGNREARVEKDEELLYGYMAVAEDLDKLDPETKKRSLVKSKKDIKAVADAPLKID